ncbi:unnamed protein product [Blepharisma stoltei]|uniref:Uncharacterized protein n=1 Tax=Blepharisma stoltei TaxID=1481888 RepID=A0AAU9KBG0_9CILI|nr:unnamed protein product [Blepharisma stoltei]
MEEELKSSPDHNSHKTSYAITHQKFTETPKKGLNSLPKLFNGKPINIYNFFALYSNSGNFNVNIPTTLIKSEDLPNHCLLRTKSNGMLHCRSCSHNEFFVFSHKNKTPDSQIYLYKSLFRESLVFQSKTSAEDFWKSSKDLSGIMQCHVECISKPVSITRVLWRLGMASKYYSIISCDKPIIRSRDTQKRVTCPASSFKRKKNVSQSIDFRYTDMMFRTSKSINNPFKVNSLSKSNLKERPKVASSEIIIDEPQLPKKSRSEDSSAEIHKKKKQIININDPEGFVVVESKNKVPEIELMINEIVYFLNAHVFKEEELKGAIFEFLNDKENKWVFLNCKEISLNSKLPAEISDLARNDAKLPQKRRSKSSVTLKLCESKPDSPICSEIDSIEQEKRHSVVDDKIKLPFRIRTTRNKLTQAKMNCSEKELLERCNKVNEKLEQIASLNPMSYLKDVNLKEQSMKSYQNRFQLENYSFNSSQPKPEPSIIETPSITKQESTTNAVFNDKILDHTRKLISDGINHLDEMKMNTELLKVKSHNIVGKYGGDEFWNRFIGSLYQKVLTYESLKSYFKHPNMKMIVDGMFKIFNGCATLEFRRNVRSSHTSLGISESNFLLYVKIFEDTLDEFEVDERDKHVIMSQIKSMKCLICRHTVL